MELKKIFTLILSNFRVIFKCKFYFRGPKKSKYLLFDRARSEFLLSYKIFSKFVILDLRLESIYLGILLKTFYKTGIKNLSKNYIKNFILHTNPKVIITFTDYNPTFFLLKDLVKEKKFKTIAVQSSYRTEENYKMFKKIFYLKYNCDYFLFLDLFTKKKIIEKIITAKFFNIGSFKNNLIKVENKRKKFDILFLSQFKSNFVKNKKNIYTREKKILKWILKLSKKYHYTFKVAIKNNISAKIKTFKENKKEYLDHFKFLSKTNVLEPRKKNNYNYVDEAKIVVFSNSTLGIEALSRGAKILSYPPVSYNLKKEFFWSMNFNYLSFRKKIIEILNMNKKKWDTMVKNSPLKIKYDINNKIFIKIIKKC